VHTHLRISYGFDFCGQVPALLCVGMEFAAKKAHDARRANLSAALARQGRLL